MIKDFTHRSTIKQKHYLEFCILLSSNLVSSCLNFKI